MEASTNFESGNENDNRDKLRNEKENGACQALPNDTYENRTVANDVSLPSQNGYVASELTFEEISISKDAAKKVSEIELVLKDNGSCAKLKELALSEYGLVSDDIRRKVWPKLLGLDTSSAISVPSQEELEAHPEYHQVVLDVNRSLKRFPPGIPYEQRVALQDQLTRLILRVIMKYPHLRYYQGYHDVAVTFLLVVEESVAFQIMERLSTDHLKDCMEPTMEKTSHLLNYIYPLIQRLSPSLYDYMEKSEVGTMFCLPWFLTWFGHSLNHYKDVVRLYDFFLASPPLMPLYVTAALVVYRQDEVFRVDCDMASIHCLLSQIPDDIPFETLLKTASKLYVDFPPSSIEVEVTARVSREMQLRKFDDTVARRRRGAGRNNRRIWHRLSLDTLVQGWAVFPRFIPRRLKVKYLMVTAALVSIYAYYQMMQSPNVDPSLTMR